jgi:hypothetical protein
MTSNYHVHASILVLLNYLSDDQICGIVMYLKPLFCTTLLTDVIVVCLETQRNSGEFLASSAANLVRDSTGRNEINYCTIIHSVRNQC